MSTHSATQGTLSDRKRAAILKAAVASFCEEGLHATSMDKIAERAGVSKRTVYNHFESKDALFDAVIDSFWQRLVPPGGQTYADLPVAQRLDALARERLAMLLDPELLGLFRAVIAESARTPELRRAYRAPQGYEDMLGFRPVLMEEAARGRLVIERPDLAAAHFTALVFGGLFWAVVLNVRGPASREEVSLVISEGIAAFLARYGAASSRPTAQSSRSSSSEEG